MTTSAYEKTAQAFCDFGDACLRIKESWRKWNALPLEAQLARLYVDLAQRQSGKDGIDRSAAQIAALAIKESVHSPGMDGLGIAWQRLECAKKAYFFRMWAEIVSVARSTPTH